MKYIVRAVKYFIKLVVLLALIFALMRWSGTSNLGAEGGIGEFFAEFFGSVKGRLFTAVLIVWCAIYPRVEFVRRRMSYDMKTRRAAIVKAFAAGGMVLVGETEEGMVFRGEGFGRRLWWLGEEKVTLTRDPSGGFEMEGPRRFVGEAVHRIPNYVEAENE